MKKSINLVLTAVFAAIILMLTLIPNLGFIRIGIVAITILHIPVLIAVFILPFFYSLFIGFTFGIASLVAAFMYGTTPLDIAFQNPVVSVLPRILFVEIAYGIRKLFYIIRKKMPKYENIISIFLTYIIYVIFSIFLPKGIKSIKNSANEELLFLIFTSILGVLFLVYSFFVIYKEKFSKSNHIIIYLVFSTIFHTFIVLLYLKVVVGFSNSILPSFLKLFEIVVSTNGIFEVLLSALVCYPIIISLNKFRGDLFDFNIWCRKY